jgi:hypothetical protein
MGKNYRAYLPDQGNSFGLRSSLESAGLKKCQPKLRSTALATQAACFFLAVLHHPDLELVAINELTETASN